VYTLGHRDPLGITVDARSGSIIASEHGAPSGTTFYDADKIPAWKNNLFVGSSRRGQIDRTGVLIRVVLDDKLQEIRQETLLESLHQRIRDVRQGPDGLLYVLTDEDNSVLMRISPVSR
jgi:glucose/arabinose dehydrogenase